MSVHIPPWSSSNQRNEFINVCICQECGARGEATYGISCYGPCPQCGSKKIKEDVGRFVDKAWRLRSETPQRLKTTAEIVNPNAPLSTNDLLRCREAMDQLETVHYRMRLVYARGNLPRRPLARVNY